MILGVSSGDLFDWGFFFHAIHVIWVARFLLEYWWIFGGKKNRALEVRGSGFGGKKMVVLREGDPPNYGKCWSVPLFINV